jgi:hypothetical protein
MVSPIDIYPEEVIEFLDQPEFRAKRIIVVGESYKRGQKEGGKHVRDRMIASKAYCYEEINVFPVKN